MMMVKSPFRVLYVAAAVTLAQAIYGRSLESEPSIATDGSETTGDDDDHEWKFLLVLGGIVLVALALLVVGCICARYKKAKKLHSQIIKGKGNSAKENATELDGDLGGFKAAKKNVTENAAFKAPVEERPSYANYMMKGADVTAFSAPKTAEVSEINEIM